MYCSVEIGVAGDMTLALFVEHERIEMDRVTSSQLPVHH
jgi:hypothetical protein